MSMKKLSLLAAITLFAGLVSACSSFAPVYGERSGISARAIRFNFAAPETRIEQIILDSLKLAFPGQAGPDDPVLDINVAIRSLPGSKSNAFSVARPALTRVEATVTVTRDDEIAFVATRFADTAYQTGKLTPVNIASTTGAQESAAQSAADALRLSILAGYRPAP